MQLKMTILDFCMSSDRTTHYDPCDCYFFYNGGVRQKCAYGTYRINETCDHDNKQCKKKPWFRCGITKKYNKNECRNNWPKDFSNWDNDKIKKFMQKPNPTTPHQPETYNLLVVLPLASFLLLAIIFIVFLIVWISIRRKRNSTPDNTRTNFEVPHLPKSSLYEEIEENVTSSSFCESSYNRSTLNTGTLEIIMENTYNNLDEEPKYETLDNEQKYPTSYENPNYKK